MPDQLTEALLQREDPQAAWQKAESIGAPGVGSHFLPTEAPKSIWDLVKEYVLGGFEVPRSIQAKDPYGIDAWMKGSAPVPGLVIGSTEPVKKAAKPIFGGLYSKLDRAFEKAPETMHPNKARSIANMATAEEQQFRGIPKLLEQKGDQPITRTEIQAHLEQNPLKISKKVLSAENKRKWYHVDLPDGETFSSDDPLEVQKVAKELGVDYSASQGRHRVPEYENYMPKGGENYKENLFYFTPEKTDATANPFQSMHFGENGSYNLLAHSRVDDRYLLNPDAKRGPKGRFIFEAQSDWHQAGRDAGYMTPENQARFNELDDQLTIIDNARQANNRKWNEIQDAYRNSLPAPSDKELKILPFDDWLEEAGYLYEPGNNTPSVIKHLREKYYPEYRNRKLKYWRNEQRVPEELLQEVKARNKELADQMMELSPEHTRLGLMVPDAPYKESWSDLLLRDQIIQAAKDPSIEWIGTSRAEPHLNMYGTQRYSWTPVLDNPEFTPDFETLRARKEALRNEYDLLTADPNTSQADLDSLFKEFNDVADRIALAPTEEKFKTNPKIREWMFSNEEQIGGHGDPIPTDETDQAILSLVTSRDDLNKLINPYDGNEKLVDRVWKRMQAEPFKMGQIMPRKEGLEQYYDKTLPTKLEKLLKPFGVRVEQLPVEGPTSGFTAWVARLTPEIKERILKEGLPLIMALYGIYQKSMEQKDAGTEN